MAETERLTITLPTEMAAAAGDYASASEVRNASPARRFSAMSRFCTINRGSRSLAGSTGRRPRNRRRDPTA